MTTYHITRDAWDSDAKEYVATATKEYTDAVEWAKDVSKYSNVRGHDNWHIVRSLVANETGGFDYFFRGEHN